MTRWKMMAGTALSLLGAFPSAARPVSYHTMMARLGAAAATGRVRVARIGESTLGRSIPLVAIGPENAPRRVMVLCQQHGDEPASTQAALRLIQRAASGDATLREATNGVELLIVPMANPDGAERGTRENGAGADLNRDWRALSQPETRAVTRAFARYRPQALLDEHEWTVHDHGGSNTLEAASSNGITGSVGQAMSGVGEGDGIPLRNTVSVEGMDGRLAHRTFGARGAAAFLLETTPGVDSEARVRLYEGIMARMARAAASLLPAKPASGKNAPVPFKTARHAPRHAHSPLPWLALGACGAALLLAAQNGKARHGAAARRQGRMRRVPLARITGLEARLDRRRVLAMAARKRKKTPGVVERRGYRAAAVRPSIASTPARVSPARRAISSRPTPAAPRR